MSSGEVLRISVSGYGSVSSITAGAYSPTRVSLTGIGNVEHVCECCSAVEPEPEPEPDATFPFWLFLESSLPEAIRVGASSSFEETPISAPESEPEPPVEGIPPDATTPVFGDIGIGDQPGFGGVVVEFFVGGGAGWHKGTYGQWDFSNNFQSDQALLIWD